MTSQLWNQYKNKTVKLIVKDIPFPRTKEGIFKAIDETHIFLDLDTGKKDAEDSKVYKLTPFLRLDIKRVEMVT